MKRFLVVMLTSLLLVGCNTLRVRGEIQEVKVPLLYCPAPSDFIRPLLEINQLTASELQSDGNVSQAYAASVLQLLGYTKELEQALKFYDDANIAYEELERRLRAAVPPKPVAGVEQ